MPTELRVTPEQLHGVAIQLIVGAGNLRDALKKVDTATLNMSGMFAGVAVGVLFGNMNLAVNRGESYAAVLESLGGQVSDAATLFNEADSILINQLGVEVGPHMASTRFSVTGFDAAGQPVVPNASRLAFPMANVTRVSATGSGELNYSGGDIVLNVDPDVTPNY